MTKIMIGWEEWVSLPKLKLPLIKVKIDTGAKISALHAVNIKPVTRNNMPYVKFTTHPFINDLTIERTVCLPIIDERNIASSNGKKECRYIVNTPLKVNNHVFDIELSLTNRSLMRFPMLLGREAIAQFAMVDPSRSYCLGKKTSTYAKQLYRTSSS
jgi:ribosomal protein S6--L-glutamate ligase